MKLFAKYRYISDQQFVTDLLANNEKALECLLYDRFRRLLRFNAMKAAPNVPVDDLVQELYLYLSADDWARLRRYDSSLPFDRWLSVVSYRFFKDYSLRMIDSRRQRYTEWVGQIGTATRPGDTDLPYPSGRRAAGSCRTIPCDSRQPLQYQTARTGKVDSKTFEGICKLT